MDNIKESWNTIKDTIKKEYELSQISYNTWIEPLKFHKLEGNTIVITIASDQSHALNYISSKYKMFFQVTISEMFNHTYDIDFILEKDIILEDDNDKYISKSKTNSSLYNANYENSNLNSKYRFDTFVVGNNNKFAHSAALAVAESPGEVYNPLYLYGGAGLGKTHLMHSIGHFALDNNPNIKVIYVTSESFTNEVIDSIRSGNAQAMTKLRDKYRKVDVLLIDDVQFIIGKESTQEEFFHTFNALHEAGKQIVISSDKPPKKMETLEERFRSRFESGLIIDIQPPDYEIRMAILIRMSENYKKIIEEDVFKYIATNFQSNIRELEGAFNRVIAKSRIENKDVINIELAQNALEDIIYTNKNRTITPSIIIEIVAQHFNIKPDDILSMKRSNDIVLPRQIVMYLCRHLTDTSYSGIGKILGRRDHSTVLHGYNKIKDQIDKNEEINDTVDNIIRKLNPSL